VCSENYIKEIVKRNNPCVLGRLVDDLYGFNWI
jgi:hypothetical protein